MAIEYKKWLILTSICVVNLIAGTMYLFGSYSPQMAAQLAYSASDVYNVAICGQSAIVLFGPVVGKIIDRTGCGIVGMFSGLVISLGYFCFYEQYVNEYSNVILTCFLFILIGMGSTSMLSVSMKCGLLTFPGNKGLATGLPNTFFGASGLFFSMIGLLFPGNTEKLLACLCGISAFISILCYPVMLLVDTEEEVKYNPLRTGDLELELNLGNDNSNFIEPKMEIEEIPVYKRYDFWNLTISLSFLAGITQMYIYSIGMFVVALNGGSSFIMSHSSDYNRYLQKNQQTQVFFLSLASCIGRLFNSFFGDLVVKWKFQRVTILFLSILLTFIGSIGGYFNNYYQNMKIFSIIFGLGYGMLYSAMVQITGEIWGTKNFSFNWGLLNLSPVFTNFVLSSIIASDLDKNSHIIKVGEDLKEMHVCDMKSACYNNVNI
ncbi:hypothetical protein DAMA08_006120 [Martiniozyma asiatica (nom. inval.)]|nr:hypothetical protein DAMA08_006120 [Martiniozyma asiatica]